MASSICMGLSPAFPVDTSADIEGLVRSFSSDYGKAIEVDFRKMVSWLKVGERATHYIHPYPAKLLPHIAHFFLSARSYFADTSTVLDPFGGSGTVALEAALSNRKALYCDANPLASLIATVKLRRVEPVLLEEYFCDVIATYISTEEPPQEVNFHNVDYWYSQEAKQALEVLKHSIESVEHEGARNFLKICFSSLCRRLSNTDPRLSVPVFKSSEILSGVTDVKGKVLSEFKQVFLKNKERMKNYISISGQSEDFSIVGSCARSLIESGHNKGLVTPNSVDMVITSPPYGGAQKYIRASSLSLGWLGMLEENSLRDYEKKNIGREHYSKNEILDCYEVGIEAANSVIRNVLAKYPLRAHIAANYLEEMKASIDSIYSALRPDGHFILIIGNNSVCGVPFMTSDYLREYCESKGFVCVLGLIDKIKSRGLMTKRNRTAGIISREWVFVFRK